MRSARILAVDDDAHHLAAVKRVLRRSHFEVTTCANPRQALQLAICKPPDLILLDVCMPAMSGQEFLRRLRHAEAQTQRNCETPVIFLSGLAASHQRVSGLDAGAEDYVTKPFDADELRARIRNRLRRFHQEEEQSAVMEEMGVAAGIECALSGIRETLRACEAPLLDLEAKLELAGLVRQPGLQKELLAQAKKDVRTLADSLTRLNAFPTVEEAVHDDRT